MATKIGPFVHRIITEYSLDISVSWLGGMFNPQEIGLNRKPVDSNEGNENDSAEFVA